MEIERLDERPRLGSDPPWHGVAIGRIIHYVSVKGEQWAGIITRVHEDGAVDLTLFIPNERPDWRQRVAHANDVTVKGTWHFPPRV